MSKPTPGPYTITSGALKKADGPVVSGDDGCVAIAMFLDFGMGPDQAKANAEAWIAGVAAIEKLERIREAMSSGRSYESVLSSINHVLWGKP